ncbi:hypothetical protein LRP31_25700 [Mesorhizobium mediterraneum]|uniref:Transcriptional regulator n=1 Tax=Mesorhizobium mediterraneum TaxID=43617 RepID=A0AB36RHD5_9HYPH|nr:hypothetical protein [Mesorhizobium mediterraneum]PAQ03685.1 hypothetical protein CIT25_03990 [Mesorhizobium mediterraneum]WIW52418.1 hypothetical protein LRP31_25700 [Mesorhizobium mediterraneum]
MNRAQIHVSQHVRSRPFSAEYALVHSEMIAAWERDRKFESAVAVMVAEIELALDHDLHELQRVA